MPRRCDFTCRYCGMPGVSCSPNTTAHGACYRARGAKWLACEHCGQPFRPTQDRSRFCSTRCYQDSKLPETFNRRYFEQETPRVAYHAGFLCADGSLTFVGGSARLAMKLHEKDRAELDALREDMGARHTTVSTGTYKSGFAITPSASFRVSHPDLVPGLRRWGIVERKSAEGIAPGPMTVELVPHFLRGLIDGDGSLCLSRCRSHVSLRPEVTLLCHPTVAEWVVSNCPWKPGVRKHKSHNGPTLTLKWSGYRAVKSLLRWLGYDDDRNLALKRKREVALRMLAQDDSNVGAAGRRGADNVNAKLTPESVREIRRRLSMGDDRLSIGRAFGVSSDAIAAIQHGKCWAWLAAVVALLFVIQGRAHSSLTCVGAYESNVRMMYPDLARLNFRDLYKRGFTTSTISGNANLHFGPTQEIGLARQMDMMVEEGIARKDKPMLALSMDGKWITEAKKVARYPDRWPELVIGNVDEPGIDKAKWVRQYSCDARALGLRNGTAIAGYALYWPLPDAADGVMADWLDVWIVLASTWQTDLYEKAKQQDANLYAYWAHDRNPDTDRYVTGLWCWRWNPEVFYHWAYNHSGLHGTLPNGEHLEDPADRNSLALGSPDGPVPTPSLLAVQEGIRDHLLLDKLGDPETSNDPWLRDLWNSIPVCCPAPPKPCPRTDWKDLRKQIARRLKH